MGGKCVLSLAAETGSASSAIRRLHRREMTTQDDWQRHVKDGAIYKNTLEVIG